METSSEVNKVSEHIEQFWRDATADDVARVWHGQRVEARFRDSENTSWYLRELIGWNTGVFICDQSEGWKQCQVYDPPEWFLNKPEPGEGWRLLEKFPHEIKLPTDEYWSNVCSQWLQIGGSNATPQADRLQVKNVWYRRRIETNSPTSSDSCRSRGTIPSGWRVLGKDEARLASDAYWSLGCKEWILIGDDLVKYANELPRCRTIRQMDRATEFYLHDNCHYKLPNGQTIRITAKGFEVGS
jgi:hypothetical protein